MWTGTRRFATNASRMDLLSEQNDLGAIWSGEEFLGRRQRLYGAECERRVREIL